MASPSSPPAGIAANASPGADSPPPPPLSRRGLPPPCWSNDETLALIESYRDKWHALGRGNLRAADWEEVATIVSRRCSGMPSSTPKTSVQCRHKIEKLRKRFRSERLRSLTLRPHAPPSSSWPFFPLLNSLDHPPRPNDSGSDSDAVGKTRRVSNGAVGLRFAIPKAVRSKVANPSACSVRDGKMMAGFGVVGARPAMEEVRRRLERKRKEEREAGTVEEVVSALRMVGDGFMRMERMKMDMAREMERMKMQMELKRTEMILDSQRQIVDMLLEGLVVGERKKKTKFSTES